jgi:CRISPR/Cas system-associated protein Cas5 (RAMP superfamily)
MGSKVKEVEANGKVYTPGEIARAETNHLEKFIERLFDRKNQVIKKEHEALIKKYAVMASEDPKAYLDRINEQFRKMVEAKDLEAWKSAERLSLRKQRFDLREKLREAGKLYGVGQEKWVFE